MLTILVGFLPTYGEQGPAAPPPLNNFEKLDLRVKNFAQSRQSKGGDRFFRVARLFGEWKLYVVAVGAMYVDDAPRGELALKGGLINVVATESLRNVVGRIRPRKTERPDAYRLKKGNSFPSGHTSAAFALATALDENYGVGYLTYPLAASTGLSRIYHNGHWLSDTLMGAGIGIASVKVVALHDEERVEPSDGSEAFAAGFAAYTVADLLAFRMEKGPWRTGLRAAAIGFSASRVEDEADLYGVFAGIASSILVTRGLTKLQRLHFGPSSVSLVWRW